VPRQQQPRPALGEPEKQSHDKRDRRNMGERDDQFSQCVRDAQVGITACQPVSDQGSQLFLPAHAAPASTPNSTARLSEAPAQAEA